MITDKALSVFRRSANASDGSADIFSRAMANVPPRSSNTRDTVVEVGMPRVLNMSRTITSVTITARKITITSWNE